MNDEIIENAWNEELLKLFYEFFRIWPREDNSRIACSAILFCWRFSGINIKNKKV